MFLHMCVCPSLHCRWYPSMPCSRSAVGGGIPACLAGFQAHTQGEVEGSGQGGLQTHTLGGISQHALRQTPQAPLDWKE